MVAGMGYRGARAVPRWVVGVGVFSRGERGATGVRRGLRRIVRAGGGWRVRDWPRHEMPRHIVILNIYISSNTIDSTVVKRR